MKTLTKELQASITPEQAIQLLKEGNERFVAGQKAERDLLKQVSETADGQFPFAVILSCIDSRTSSELIFDLGMGDVFNVRIAGNVANADILGSMEFACKVAGAKAIVVLGHSRCGAVKGACDGVKLGNLSTLLEKLEPAVAAEKTVTDERNASNSDFVEKVAELNVHLTMEQIAAQSPILKELVDSGQAALVGGMYDVETGKVTFYDQSAT